MSKFVNPADAAAHYALGYERGFRALQRTLVTCLGDRAGDARLSEEARRDLAELCLAVEGLTPPVAAP